MLKKCVTQDIALLRETSIPNLPNLDMIFNLRLNYSPFTHPPKIRTLAIFYLVSRSTNSV